MSVVFHNKSWASENDLIAEVHRLAKDGVAPEAIEARTGHSLKELAEIESRVQARKLVS